MFVSQLKLRFQIVKNFKISSFKLLIDIENFIN
jgi:hypothetical protein